MTQASSLEFSYPVEIGRMASNGYTIKISANAEQCIAVAKRMGLRQLHSLAAELHMQFIPQTDVLEIRGTVNASYRQNCVITDEALQQQLRFEFLSPCMDVDKIAQIKDPAGKEAELLDEGFEPIIHNMIDVGELVVQQFMIHIDPYPRAENADLDTHLREVGQEPYSPFAVLKGWKKS